MKSLNANVYYYNLYFHPVHDNPRQDNAEITGSKILY